MAPMLAAQDKPKDTKATSVPESAMPPAGMCRLWLPDVPERQQPAPTDCATAIRTMPRDAMVLFGDLKRAASQTSLSPAAAAAVAHQQAAGREQAAAREVPGYRGPNRTSGVRAEVNPRTATAAAGTQATAAVRAAPAGTAAATKAPDTKAAVVKPPENRQ